MGKWKVLLGLVVFPFLLAGWPAAGQETGSKKILVLNPESRVLNPNKLRNLGKHLRFLIRRYPSLEVLEIPSLQFKVMKRKAKCRGSETECLVSIGRQVGVNRFLHSEVQKLPGRYLVVMKLVDVDVGRLIETSRQRARRRIGSLRGALLKGWVDLFGSLIRSQLQVSANVVGADVFLDGRNIGKTPLILTKDLGKGTHIIEVTHLDCLPARQEIQIAKGRKLKVSVMLEEKPTEVAVAPQPPPAPAEGKKIGGKEEQDPAELLPPPPPSPPSPTPVVEEKVETPPGSKSLPSKQPDPRPFLPSFETIGGVEKKKPGEKLRISESGPIYKQWWFWTAVGVVVVGGVTGLVVGLTDEDEGIPAGRGRVVIEF
jgi:hypothetical protein